MTVDTGCSTSLTALHQACQSLRARESDMSIIGGANVMLNPDMFAVMSSLTYVDATTALVFMCGKGLTLTTAQSSLGGR